MHGFKGSLIVVLGIVALAVPAGALAKQGENPGKGNHEGKGQQGDHGKGKGKGHGPHAVAWVFKGYYKGEGSVAGEASIEVKHGNSRVRKGGYIGHLVAFDLSGARIVVADVNADGQRDLADVAVGDWVLVKARLPRTDPGDQPFEAKGLIDKGMPYVGQGN